MAKKSKEVKFTKQEIDSLQQLRSDYANVELSLGKQALLIVVPYVKSPLSAFIDPFKI